MKIKNLLFLGLLAAASVPVYAQDLIRKVPQDANIVMTFDSQKFFSLLPASSIDEKFTALGVFEGLNQTLRSPISGIADFGINMQAKGYFYSRKTDSVTFVGALIPLIDQQKLKNILVAGGKEITTVNGLESMYLDGGDVRLSWDNNTLYVLSTILDENFFNDSDNRALYGLSERVAVDYSASWEYTDMAADTAAVAVMDYDSEAWATADTVVAVEEIWDEGELPVTVEIYADTAKIGNEEDVIMLAPAHPMISMPDYGDDDDSIYYDIDTYDDEAYLESMRVARVDDSIKNVLKLEWLNAEMAQTIQGTRTYGKEFPALVNRLKPNTVANVYVRDLNRLYSDFLPVSVLTAYYGVNANFDLGFRELSYDFIVDNNVMKLSGTLGVADEMASHLKAVYKSKINPKFLNYVSPEDLGFISFHMNTEAYIKYIPAYLNQYKNVFGEKLSSYYEIGAVLFDVLLDEKAISKVYKGDNLFVLNGLTQKEVTYIDYDYDDDYNPIETERTKMETVPSFLYMFGSDDQRIFEKIMQLGIQENQVFQENGIYTLSTGEKLIPEIYFAFEKGIIFLGNDYDKIASIHSNSYKSNANAAYTKLIKKNNFSMLFNINKVPTLLNQMDVPIPITMKQTVETLASYGDVSLTSTGMKGNKLFAELAIEFPKENDNALNYLFDFVTNLIEENN
ncbi:hypothetical protein [Sphingobacterium hungaricum]